MAALGRESTASRGRRLNFATLRARLRRALVIAAGRVAPLAYRKRRFSYQLTRNCRKDAGNSELTVTVSVRPGSDRDRHLVAIARKHAHIHAACIDRLILRDPEGAYARLSGVLAVIARVPLDPFRALADLSDGETGGPGVLAFCSRDPRAILVPDPEFVATRGYEGYRLFARNNLTPWRARSDHIVWRGSTTGYGIIASDSLSADDPALIPRVRLCLSLRGAPLTDVKISGVAQSREPSRDKDRLARAGIMGDFMSPMTWHGFKFAIDIDGNSNAWSNLLMRLIIGCCVLKVASPLNYRQWYYDDLEPWIHYVPVKADLSDLTEQVAWCRANLDACERIAAAGQAFAMARSYATEIVSAVERVCAASREGRLRTQDL